ncbi:MAG: hypothetical protein K2M17_02175 [Bacilli bacterium]|nr:hypothetical protein [Bacilli bacterium]
MDKKNCNIFWISNELLHIEYQGETKNMTPQEALIQYKDNQVVIAKINSLLERREKNVEIADVDAQFQELQGLDEIGEDLSSYAPEAMKIDKEKCSVFWINDEQLQIEYQGKIKIMTPQEAFVQYNGNQVIMDKIGGLFKIREEEEEIAAFAQFQESLELGEINEDLGLYSQRRGNDATKGIQIRPISMEERNRIVEEIETEMARITDELGLVPSDNMIVQLQNCCKLQKYIATHNGFNEEVMKEKQEYPYDFIRTMDLYNGVVRKSGVCTSEAYAFQEILSRLGMTVECVGLISAKGGMHMANLVLLDGEYYFFDPRNEQALFEKKNVSADEICLCFAGLGSNEYCEYFKPKVIVPRNIFDEVKEIPDNIAKERIPYIIIEEMLKPQSR